MKKDILYFGIPCLYYNKRYVIFSPYKKKIAILNEKEIKNNSIKEQLEKEGFFGEPIPKKDIIGRRKIIICTTSDCNLRCKYCFVEAGDKCNYLESDIAIKLIKDNLKYNPKELSIQFFGGEPTLNFKVIKDCVEYLKGIKGLKKFYEITTNGIIAPKILDYLIENNFFFSISLDGLRKINDFQRPLSNGGGSYNLVLNTIKRIKEKNCEIKLRTTVTSVSVKNLPKFIDEISKIGINIIHLEPFIPLGRGKKNKFLELKANEYIKQFKKALDMAKKRDIKITQFGLFSIFEPLKQHCLSFYGNRMVLLPDGSLTYCLGCSEEYSQFSKIFCMGKYNKKTKMFDYKKPKIFEISLDYVDKIKKCKNCFAKYICSGICPANNIIRQGDPYKIDKFSCKIRKEIIRDAILRIYKEK